MRIGLVLFTLAAVGMAVWAGIGVQTESMLTETFHLHYYRSLEILPAGLEFRKHDLQSSCILLFVLAAFSAVAAGILSNEKDLLWLLMYGISLMGTCTIAFIWGLYLGTSFGGIVAGLMALSILLLLLTGGTAIANLSKDA